MVEKMARDDYLNAVVILAQQRVIVLKLFIANIDDGHAPVGSKMDRNDHLVESKQIYLGLQGKNNH